MNIYLTRHGQTEWNLIKKIQGFLDSPLTEKGIIDAKKLGNRLKKVNLDIAYASTQERAIKTAEIIIGSREKVICLDELKEISVGNWEGMYYKDIQDQYRDEFNLYKYHPHLYKPKNGGEDYEVFQKRVESFVNLLKEEDRENVLIVTHGLTYIMLLNIFEGGEIKDLGKRQVPHGTSLSLIKYDGGDFKVIFEDDSSHLE